MADIVSKSENKEGQMQYEVSYGTAAGGESQVTIDEASLPALATELGTDYIAQSEIEAVISGMAAASGKEIPAQEQLAFAQTMTSRAVAATSEHASMFDVATCGADFGCLCASEEIQAMKSAVDAQQEGEGDTSEYILELSTPYCGIAITTTCSAASAMLQQIEAHSASASSAQEVHTAAIEALTSVADVVAYDYSSGWPEGLKFSF